MPSDRHQLRQQVCVAGSRGMGKGRHSTCQRPSESREKGRGRMAAAPVVALASDNLIDAHAVDYLLIAIYFAFVLGIGVLASRRVSDSVDFFLSGRSLPAWVTGLAFISANLGAVEIMGMSANGAQFGLPSVHYF